MYNAKTFILDNYNKKKQKKEEDRRQKKALDYLVDEGMIISSLTPAEHGLVYNNTISVFNGMIFALGVQGLLKFN